MTSNPETAQPAPPQHPAHLTDHRLRVLAVICEDRPGVLERVASQIRRRGFNIATLSVGPTVEGLSRMTLTVDAGHAEVDQVGKQLDKLIEVIEVQDITDDELVSRELVLARVRVEGHGRDALVGRVAHLGGRVVDAINGQVTFELAADTARVDALLELLEPHGLTEIVRSGPLALKRQSGGGPPTTPPPEQTRRRP
jgi:acetolactate synthase-1/3 small subunit